MKVKNKERSKSKSKSKLQNKNINNDKVKSNNPFYPIKYFCFNEVKKIVNNKNKKSPILNKNNEKQINLKKKDKIKREEEDEYNKTIYDKRIIILQNKSFTNILKNNFNYIDENNLKIKKLNSTDERYKTIIKFGLYTKQLFHSFKIKKCINNNLEAKNSKFSKKNKFKKKSNNKIKLSNAYHYNYLDIHDITNINSNNIIYRTNNINDSNNTITSNSITSKTITNNTMSNYTISNITPSSYHNKSNNMIHGINKNNVQNKSKNNEHTPKIQDIKNNNNIKIIKNKVKNKKNNNINKNIKKKNISNKEKENAVFVRRIILEEKFTIDSKGDKKTIYIKKISPIIKSKEPLSSTEKKLFNNSKIFKNNSNYNNKDNTYINHNDINLNFNVCSFQKIDLNHNNHNNNIDKKNSKKKMESFEDINNDTSINDTLLENCKYLLSIKNGNKIIYEKPNGILFKTENNHKSYQSLFSSPKKRYYIQLNGNESNKKRYKINQKAINNDINNKKNNIIKKSSTKNFQYNNSPLKNKIANPRFLKNKMVHRKAKTNFIFPNNIDYENFIDYNPENEENSIISNKRSFSFVGKTPVFNLVKKYKDNKKIELKNKLKNSHSPGVLKSINNHSTKIKEYINFTPLDSLKSSKNNTKINSINNSRYIQKINKSNLCININESNENQRCHSLNRIINKKNYNSNEFKLFLNYLKNNMTSNNDRNKSHRHFLGKKSDKSNLDKLNKKNNNSVNKKGKNNFIYMKIKPKKI